MHSNKRERVSEACAGDIIAAIGLKNTSTGDTICDESDPIILESIEFYEPVISQAIEARTRVIRKSSHPLSKNWQVKTPHLRSNMMTKRPRL